MVNIIKEELPIEEHLRKKLELICEFAKTTPTIINENIRRIDKTNLTYIEPNRIIIKDTIDKLKISKLNKDKYILSKEDKDSFIDFIEQVNDTSKEYDKIQTLSNTLVNAHEQLKDKNNKIKTLTENNEALNLRVKALN